VKRAFTLIEIVVSIAIFSIIAVYMYQAINTMQKSNELNSMHYSEDTKKQKIIRLFYNDIFSKTDIYAAANITNSDEFDIFRLRTKNSIHAMINPHVVYFVNDNSLYRIESRETENIPLSHDSAQRVKSDKLLDNVTLFRVNANRNSYIISYESSEKFTMFQISLPPLQTSSNTLRNNQSVKP
jgi:prepilin-type N-terminal cleavage/methylation domain-containing protein